MHKPTRRFAPCRLDFDTPLSSTAALPQSPLPSRRHSWLLSTNPLTCLGFLTLYSTIRVACLFLPLALTLHPPSLLLSSFLLFPFPSLSILLTTKLVDDDAFLDCLHVIYSLSNIFCDALMPPHGAVNWSEHNSSTSV